MNLQHNFLEPTKSKFCPKVPHPLNHEAEIIEIEANILAMKNGSFQSSAFQFFFLDRETRKVERAVSL